MEYIVLWGIFGVIAGAISNGRGNGFGGGCLWGLILGPIGILIALLYAPSAKTVEQRQLASGKFRKCPFCAESIRIDAVVCRYCGRDLPRPAVQVRAVIPAGEEINWPAMWPLAGILGLLVVVIIAMFATGMI